MCSLSMFFWSNSGRQNPHFRREGGFHRSQAKRRARKNNIFLSGKCLFFVWFELDSKGGPRARTT